MGWWSCTVMGGDTPLDLQADLIETAGTDYEYFQDKLNFDMTKLKDGFTEHLGEMIMFCENRQNDRFCDERNVAFQVLGAITMEAGTTIPDSVRTKIIDGAKNDGWAYNDSERKQHMDAFISVVETYDNTPTKIPYESLFQKFAEKLS